MLCHHLTTSYQFISFCSEHHWHRVTSFTHLKPTWTWRREKMVIQMFQKPCQNIPQSSNESYQKRCIALLSWVGASERNYPTVVLCCEQQWICCLHWIFLLWWTLFQKLSKPSMFSSNPGFTIMPPPYSALSASAMHCLFSNQ